ncbi:sugar transferase [Ruminococcus sp.]|uniref:sugar transferase n=1 Tax=Ruminococcus sp. TaxID=41978 RepID=UPI001B4E938E|nr:sugar transferase [Ruminococcus sp.]MBP5432982.1 sugar transferase [Ruminococcus sp.]
MYKNLIKRILDIFIGLMFLPFFCIIFIVVAPAIWINDRGPVFYNAKRLGRKGKIYKMYKFRSMKINSPDLRNEDGSTYNSEDDPRVTTIGKILRKTSIDETPQFLNVLKGDMSVIGPRPFVTTHYNGYDKLDSKMKKRLEVRPGITGYSQANFRNSISQDEKIEKDCYYADHVSLILDIKIFFQTIKSVLMHENIYVSDNIKAETKDKVKQ